MDNNPSVDSAERGPIYCPRVRGRKDGPSRTEEARLYDKLARRVTLESLMASEDMPDVEAPEMDV
jgi:hypothetical protein